MQHPLFYHILTHIHHASSNLHLQQLFRLLYFKYKYHGKNLPFKAGGVDGCDCAEILSLIEQGKIDTTPLITHRYRLADIEEAYRVFEGKLDGVIKIAVEP